VVAEDLLGDDQLSTIYNIIVKAEEEKMNNMTMTPYIQNLTTLPNIAKNELSFIKVIIRPLWELTVQIFGRQLQLTVDNIDKNIKEWEKLMQ
jgi:hypothetical protein